MPKFSSLPVSSIVVPVFDFISISVALFVHFIEFLTSILKELWVMHEIEYLFWTGWYSFVFMLREFLK